jgi:hypothetical protein
VRIQPRQQILDIWRSVIQSSFKDGVWQWGPKEERNSIRDAEQVLCLLYPATELPNLALDRPDSTAEDVVKALAPLGRPTAIAMKVIEVLADYIDEYTDDDGEPVFSGGSYLRTRNASDGKGGRSKGDVISEEQRSLEVVDSYSMSVTLCLATLGFISVFHTSVRKPTTQQFIGKLEKAVRDRLTAAMVGLLRSFVVNIVDENDSAREVMLRTVSPTRIQDQVQEQAVIAGLNERLSRVRARLRDDVRLGVGEDVKEGLRHESMLFECGWGWGIVQNATPFKIELSYTGFTDQPKICSVDGVADARPYLYSTVVALDGINDLLSARTRELGLLNEDQRRLSDALQVRWDQTQRYWSTIARFGEGDWPLEDIPWRTSDGDENSYYSLVVSSVLVQDLENREATDDDLNRAVAVFSALGARGRITRRVTVDDAAVEMHVPGVQMSLGGSETLGARLYWTVADFAPLLLKRTLQAARLSQNVAARTALMDLADQTMTHLDRRRITQGPAAGLWDEPAEVLFPTQKREPTTQPSWYMTERVVEALVAGARTFRASSVRSPAVATRAQELLHEAEHLLNREMLDADADDTSAKRSELNKIEAILIRANKIIIQQPGTANALAMDALRRLDELAVAHQDATRSM